VSPGRLRVVHVASAPEWRGGQRQVLLLARELAHRGLDQLVVTTERSRLAEALAEAGIPTRTTPWATALSPRTFLALLAEARPGTVLHSHDGHAITLAALAAGGRRAPLVAHRRTAFPLRRPWFWRRADRVIAISDAVRAQVEAAGIRSDRVVTIPDGVDLDRIRAAAPGPIREQLRLPATAPLAVTVSALTAEKGLDDLITAAASLLRSQPGLHWVVAGAGPLRDRLVARARDAGLGARIHFTGWLDDPLPLIATATVFVAPSTVEGLGTTVLDAMALAVPVVATAAGGLPELVRPGAGLLVPPGSPPELAGAVSRILSDPAAARTLAEAGRDVAARHAVGGMAEATLTVYRSLSLAVDAQ
jgi:L-malate glycosyltransferase